MRRSIVFFLAASALSPTFACAQLMRFSNGSGKFGFTDAQGAVVVAPRFDSARSAARGGYFVWSGGKAGLLSSKGKELIPVRYDAFRTSKSGHIEAALRGKKGLFAMGGAEIVPVKFDELRVLDNKTIEVRLKSETGIKFGLWTWSGKELLAAEYDKISFEGYRQARGIKAGRSEFVSF